MLQYKIYFAGNTTDNFTINIIFENSDETNIDVSTIIAKYVTLKKKIKQLQEK